jgi:hypothetical protein
VTTARVTMPATTTAATAEPSSRRAVPRAAQLARPSADHPERMMFGRLPAGSL